MTETYRALVVDRDGEGGAAVARLTDLPVRALEAGEVRVSVEYSGINYKDALAVTGRPGVLRAHPITAGIDLSGMVVESTDARWRVGDRVLVNGWEIGERHDGGLAEQAVVRGDWLTRIPDALSAWQAAALGTAGFTAALSVLAAEKANAPAGETLVTGAGGGVGGLSIMLAARGPDGAGRPVVAVTGRPELEPYLRSLGAHAVLDRVELSRESKPLESERWAVVLDAVGGQTLATALAQLRYGGLATTCGLAESSALRTTVLPFILRGVRLQGINSVLASAADRAAGWQLLADRVDGDLLDGLTRTVPLGEVVGLAEDVLAGRVRGRIAVAVRQ